MLKMENETLEQIKNDYIFLISEHHQTIGD
ncbi:hypothetical protein CoNPh11_CDS0016 [Staphylococcus phage S-CoN_Ph11]|nr:hypothetical protein CoNPh11_CDS0016 [Staphylococcus phage S-CoN_Ph11]